MKKILFILFGLVFCFVFSSPKVEAFDWTQCEERDFVLTAYYSPVVGQSFYYKSDFNGEIKLNGERTHGASGEPVFNGMLAAPANYPFGGRIYFPDMGLGKISDRGGAIVNAGERRFSSDRIDVWVGYGEEGLIRALDFGVQRKKGYYCEKIALPMAVWNSLSQEKIGLGLKNIPIFENFFDIAIWKEELRYGRRDIWVWTMQKYLVKLGYLPKNKQSGRFDLATKNALCRYQTKKLISYPSHASCGVYGPKTRFAMQKDAEKRGFLPKDFRQHGTVDTIKKQANSRDLAKELIVKQKSSNAYFDEPFYKNTYNEKVEKLQYLLEYLGYYDAEIDGVFDDEIINAVHRFQLAEHILKGLPSEANVAGYVGPATRAKLNSKLKQKHEDEKLVQLDELFTKDEVEKKLDFAFYRPYTKGEGPNAEVRILQKFMKDLGLYKADVHGIYDSSTIDSVYNFQIKYGLLTEDSHYTLHGYLGPGTRKKINEMRLFGL